MAELAELRKDLRTPMPCGCWLDLNKDGSLYCRRCANHGGDFLAFLRYAASILSEAESPSKEG